MNASRSRQIRRLAAWLCAGDTEAQKTPHSIFRRIVRVVFPAKTGAADLAVDVKNYQAFAARQSRIERNLKRAWQACKRSKTFDRFVVEVRQAWIAAGNADPVEVEKQAAATA